MKKFISLFVSIVMFVGMFSTTTNAYAAGWASYAKSVGLNTWYNDMASTSDCYSKGYDYYGYYADIYKIYVPQKGVISIKMCAECNDYMLATLEDEINIYNSNNTEQKCFSNYRQYDGYDAGNGCYYDTYNVNLNKGTYYIEITFGKNSVDNKYYEGSYDVIFNYTPTFPNTSISKTTAKKKSFNVKWKKASSVTGYEIQYSTKKNMKSSKKIKVKKASTTSKTIKGLKAKKKYYMRVRTYKTVKVNGQNKTYYGKWSGKKSVKTKQ